MPQVHLSGAAQAGLLAVAIVAAAAALQLGAAWIALPTADRATDEPALVRPARRSPDAPPPAPPAVPEEIERLVPLTLDLSIRMAGADGAVRQLRQTIARTGDRVHLQTIDGPEWYFERNPRAPRRASGALIEHDSTTIIIYSDADLRNELGIAGWASIVTLGIDHALLGTLDRTSDVRTVDGVRFMKYASTGAAAIHREVWWNRDHALPAAAVTRQADREVRLAVERIRPGAEPQLLRHPAQRFPEYRQIDVADWHERQ